MLVMSFTALPQRFKLVFVDYICCNHQNSYDQRAPYNHGIKMNVTLVTIFVKVSDSCNRRSKLGFWYIVSF